MQIIEMVKSHPVPIAIGVCLLILLVSRGSGSGSASASNSSGASLAASAMTNNTQLATVNAGMAVQLGAQSVEKYQIGENAALARTGVASSMMQMMVQSNAGLIASSTASNAGLVAKAIDASNSLKQFQINSDVQQSAITANVKVNSDNLLAQVQMNADDNNNKLAVIGAQTQGNLALMGLSGDISTKQLGMNLATLPTIMQGQQEMLRIQGANDLNIAKLQNDVDMTYARTNRTKVESTWANQINDGVLKWFKLF